MIAVLIPLALAAQDAREFDRMEAEMRAMKTDHDQREKQRTADDERYRLRLIQDVLDAWNAYIKSHNEGREDVKAMRAVNRAQTKLEGSGLWAR